MFTFFQGVKTMEFSQILKQLRAERGMSQQEVADRLGLNKQAVSQYERGVRNPSFEIAEMLADIFNVDLNYLLGYSDKVARLSGDHTDPTSGTYVEVTAAELELLKAYRHAGAETQAAIRAILHI